MRVRWVAVTAAVATTVGIVALAAGAGAAPTVALSVNVLSARHAISPFIYGVNFASDVAGLKNAYRVPVNRWGGNATSRYNYKTQFTNTGSDWYFENIRQTGAATLESFVAGNKKAKMTSVVTVPMIGYVAKQGSATQHPFTCGFTAAMYPQQDSFDPYDPNCGNGQHNNQPLQPQAPTVTSQAAPASWDGAMVSYLVKKFGTAAKGGVSIYELDNEPVLWNSTHRDVHPNPLSYNELKSKSLATAAAIKKADPTAKVLGPSDWGYCAYFYSAVDNCGQASSDRAAHANMDLAPWYLQQFAAASAKAHKRLLDYFDEHFYPQEQSATQGVALSPAGDAATQALRLRSTRSLWDPTYTDESWISGQAHPKLAFIRLMKSWVAKYYPGTKTAITEYNFGGLESINGALAEADVLGIFGREGLDLATLWAPPTADQPGAFAFRMFENYDGKFSRFGDVSVKAASTDQGQVAVYAAQRTSDKALTMMVINKTGNPLTVPLNLSGFTTRAAAMNYQYSSANLHAILRQPDLRVTAGRITATYPANSITLLVLPKK